MHGRRSRRGGWVELARGDKTGALLRGAFLLFLAFLCLFLLVVETDEDRFVVLQNVSETHGARNNARQEARRP